MMRKIFEQINLSNKLSFLVVLVILVSFSVLGFYFDSFLKEHYFQNTKKRMLHGYQRIASNVTNTNDELTKGIAFVQSNESFLASIDLINNYQDKENYNAILLDEEKKNIAQQLLSRVKLSLNHDIALYDQHEELIAIVIKTSRGYQLNFISFQQGKKILYSKYEQDESYLQKDFAEYKIMPFKHKAFYENGVPSPFAVISYHFYENEVFIKSHRNIFSEYENKIIAHIEMSNLLGKTYFKNLSHDLDLQISISKNENYAAQANPLFNKETYEQFNIQQTDESYIAAMCLQALEGEVYLVATLQKSRLKTTLNDNRKKLFILFLIVIFTILVLLRFLFLRGLASPLKKLMRQITKIEQHNYSTSTQVNTRDELGIISKNINTLATTICLRESALHKTQENLKYLSYHDPLTNLPNRRFFNKQLQKSLDLAAKNQTKIAILFLDLDKFKEVNDLLGHNIGDILLKEVSNRLSFRFHGINNLARIGGDEFQVIIENVRFLSELDNLIKKILNDFKRAFICAEHEIKTTISIGIALYPNDGTDCITLIKNSDLAMYESKAKGGNNFSYFSKALSDRLKERMERINALKIAVETCDEFVLLYQPKISVKTKKIIAVEALIRWNSATLGFVRPDQFITLAEETNLIVPLGDWILKQACSDFVKLQQEGYALEHISINVSNVQLLNSDVLGTLQNILEETGLDSNYVELEITESYIASDEKKALETLQSFRAMNIKLAIDDFGTGYSSLSYLQKLPVTRLKIDKSFVDDLPESLASVAIANAIIGLAKTFNLAITAEGVENKAQLEFLQNAHCDDIQGYYYAKPLSLEELKQFYNQQRESLNLVKNT